MSNDFPFNHFINYEKNNKNNNIEASNIESHVFPHLSEKENISSGLNSEFNKDELESIACEVLESLKSTINPQKYNAFFANTFILTSLSETTIEFSATTNFIKKMIETHYSNDLEQIIHTTLGKKYKVKIKIMNNHNTSPNHNQKFNESKLTDSLSINDDIIPKGSSSTVKTTSFRLDVPNRGVVSDEEIHDEINSAVIKHNTRSYFGNRIDKTKIFDNFIVGPSNNMAHAFSQAVSRDPGKVYPQLYIHGNSGLGKTHLLHAMCNYINETRAHLKVCFTTANDFMSEMVLAIQGTTGNSNKISEFRRKYTEMVDVLIIDDIHELKNKTRTQSEFFYIFNELQSKGKQLVFTSDKTPKEIAGIEDRIRTRLSSALLIDIQQPDLETRIAILKKKAAEKDIFLDDDVINLIASCIKSNVRELEGNLVKLGAYSDLMNVDIDLEIAKEQLNLAEGFDEKIITIESITKSVASYFKLTLGDIKGKTRKKEVAMARHISMYMAHKILKKTLEEIGEFFDNRDHSTVIHGIKKIQNLIKENTKISQQIYEIESRI